ncbi:DUF2971 domain-containing protein [Methanohalophilus halophilus]|nr:DUF2971 domain-containing protein [Methanohalophilus halophilus]APH39483.1 hypothetical protein BHR79_08320 [Methanohalophilus halophilus]SDW27615.1 Protein of unknown function [Methanohalophilus halophilus]
MYSTKYTFSKSKLVLRKKTLMETLRLLKFRSLSNDVELGYIQDILKKNEFWCSKLWNLNDPMEGVFSTYRPEKVDEIFSEKNNTVICSFSGEETLSCPLMWGYYANGFKGVAIETEVKLDKNDNIINEDKNIGGKVIKVDYNNINFTRVNNLTVEKIMTRKLENWSHEDEYRFLKNAEEGLHQIGTVSKVYFGAPYHNIENKAEIKSASNNLQKYEDLKDELISSCENYDHSGGTISFKDCTIDYNGLIETKQILSLR